MSDYVLQDNESKGSIWQWFPLLLQSSLTRLGVGLYCDDHHYKALYSAIEKSCSPGYLNANIYFVSIICIRRVFAPGVVAGHPSTVITCVGGLLDWPRPKGQHSRSHLWQPSRLGAHRWALPAISLSECLSVQPPNENPNLPSFVSSHNALKPARCVNVNAIHLPSDTKATSSTATAL